MPVSITISLLSLSPSYFSHYHLVGDVCWQVCSRICITLTLLTSSVRGATLTENVPRGLRLGTLLIQHLKCFDTSARKMKNDVEFPLVNLILLNHVTMSANGIASYNLCGVTIIMDPKMLNTVSLCIPWDRILSTNVIIKI